MRNYSSPRIRSLSILADAETFVAKPLLAVRLAFYFGI